MPRPEPLRRVSVTAAIHMAEVLVSRPGVPDYLDRTISDAADMIRALADEVTLLRQRLYELAARAEDGLSTADIYAHAADALGVDVGDLRRWAEAP